MVPYLLFIDGLETLSLGQALDLHWKYHGICPSVDDYLSMIDSKTGAFFRMTAELMGTEGRNAITPELLDLICLTGRYYQLRDDLLNLSSDQVGFPEDCACFPHIKRLADHVSSRKYTLTKGFCDDLNEGKYSLPLIHFLQNAQSPELVSGLLRNRATSNEEMSDSVKAWILAQMKAAGSLDYTRKVVDELFSTMWEMLDELEAKLGKNSKLRVLLLELK
jgi:geranylgeranyl diphosphate synthase type 3